jgi:hypothetical protein
MKYIFKLFFSLAIILFISMSFVFADEAFDRELDERVEKALGDTSELIELTNSLINHGLFRNKKMISELTFDLDFTDRNNLFNKYYMEPSDFTALNFWPGFGIGSLGQRDILAFVPHMIIDGAGALALGVGATVISTVFVIDLTATVIIYLGAAMSGNSIDSFQMVFGAEPYKWSAIVMASGLGACLVSRLISMIWPGVYAKRYNKTLRNTLDIPVQQTDVSFVPLIDPVNKQFGLAAKIIL